MFEGEYDMNNITKMTNKEKNCKKCGRLFLYYGFGHMYCPTCQKMDNEMFQKVKDYIYEKGPSTMGEVAEATGVPIQQIDLYLKEGRLEIPPNSKLFIKCESCGVEMRSGRYCPTCASRLSKDLSVRSNFIMDEVGELKKDPTPGKMHFLNL